MTEDAQLKIRLPQDLKSIIEDRAKLNHRTMNGEIVSILEKSLKSETNSGRSIFFNDMNCVDNIKEVSLQEQQDYIMKCISDLFYENPEYDLINVETLNDGYKIRYWYSIPASQDARRK